MSTSRAAALMAAASCVAGPALAAPPAKLDARAYVTFALSADGAVDRASMKAVSPLADFSFDYADLDLRPAPPKR